MHNLSLKRSGHTAWTPPSLPNTIVLIGNEDMGIGIGMDIAETVPGIQVKAKYPLFLFRWRNIHLKTQRS